jgi:hypothetical protein
VIDRYDAKTFSVLVLFSSFVKGLLYLIFNLSFHVNSFNIPNKDYEQFLSWELTSSNGT